MGDVGIQLPPLLQYEGVIVGVIGHHKLRVLSLWEMHALITNRLQYMLLIGKFHFSVPINGIWQKKC